MFPVRGLLADDRGFTLMELLVSIAIGSVILTAALMTFVNGMGASASVQDRSDAAQRARIGFDRVTALVGAQVCNGVGTSGAPVTSAGPNSVSFTANMDDVDSDATGYQLRYEAATQSLWEYRYPLSSTETPAGYRTWASTPSSKQQLLERVVPESGTRVFRFYGTDNPTTGDPVELGAGASALNADERTRVLRIDLSLRVLPTRTKSTDDRTATLMTSESYVTSNLVTSELDQGPRC